MRPTCKSEPCSRIRRSTVSIASKARSYKIWIARMAAFYNCRLVGRMAASYTSPLVKRTICLLWRLSGRRWRSALAW